MDNHAELRSLPLVAVFSALGITTEWNTRKGGTEFYGRCPHPDHNPKSNSTTMEKPPA